MPWGFSSSSFRRSSATIFDAAFAKLVEQRAGGLVVMPDGLLNSRTVNIVALAARHAALVIYTVREFAEAGGLISYGPHRDEVYRQAGIYISRILKGEKPASLPVMLPIKFNLVVNLKAAKAIGLNYPQAFLLRADEVIE